jgi:hypothetical protein
LMLNLSIRIRQWHKAVAFAEGPTLACTLLLCKWMASRQGNRITFATEF